MASIVVVSILLKAKHKYRGTGKLVGWTGCS
jgi:hypothetical protein